jgi:hypothetical protein
VTTISVPELQRDQALNHANRIRLARCTLRRRIKTGEAPLLDVILAPPAEASTWPIFDALKAQPRWAEVKARKLLRGLAIPEFKSLGELTDRQRERIAQALIDGGARVR